MLDEQSATTVAEQTPAAGGGAPPADQQTPPAGDGKTTPPSDGKTDQQQTAKPNGKTIVAGADSEADAKAKEEQEAKDHKPYWPDNWREKLAEHIAAGDKKAYDKELKRLQRISDPSGVYGMYRELEGKFTSGGLVKVPGKDAKPEEKQAFWKQLGVPEKPEEYFENIKLENGAVIGEADKPLVNSFAERLHKVGATPEVMSEALNWYYAQQEQIAAELDEADETFRVESERALKEELGPAFKREVNALQSVFATSAGGADISNPNSTMARLLGGRTNDGKIIGNDPEIIRWLVSIRRELNPSATVVESGDNSGKSIDEEIAAIEKDMRTDRRAYFKDEAKQARYRELLEARDKVRARGA